MDKKMVVTGLVVSVVSSSITYVICEGRRRKDNKRLLEAAAHIAVETAMQINQEIMQNAKEAMAE